MDLQTKYLRAPSSWIIKKPRMDRRYKLRPRRALQRTSDVNRTFENILEKQSVNRRNYQNDFLKIVSNPYLGQHNVVFKSESDRVKAVGKRNDKNSDYDEEYQETYETEIRRANVWTDSEEIDEIFFKQKTDRNKREISSEPSTSESVLSDNFGFSARVENDRAMWEMEPPDLTDCDCLGPPPEFLLPPPPRPPFLQSEYYCGDDPIPDLETCETEPKIDAYNHSSPSLQTSAVIALCSIVLVVGILIGALLVWKHKRKVTNLFPSKSTGGSTTVATPAPAPLYEDLPELPHRPAPPRATPPRAPPHLAPRTRGEEQNLEMVESKQVFVCGAGAWRGGGACGGDACGAPLYEELPRRASDDSLPGSTDGHFAEDELSLVGEPACRACPPRAPPASLPHRAPRPRVERRPRSLDRRRGGAPPRPPRQLHAAEFHEGVLLDALLRLYPTVGTVGVARGRCARAPPAAWPGDLPLPGAPCWRARASPKPPSQDSSFGSDSGYSNNTCGTCGTRASSRHRLSAELGLS